MPARWVSVAPSYQESRPPSVAGPADVARRRLHHADDRLRLRDLERHHAVRPPLHGGRMLGEPVVLRALAGDPVLDLAPHVGAPAVGVRLPRHVHDGDASGRTAAGYVTGHSPAAAIVGSSAGRDRYGWSRPSRAAHSARSERIASTTTVDFSIAFTAPPSRQSGWRTSACPGRPGTRTRAYSEPRQATHTSKPVASVTMPASARRPRSTIAVPPAPDDSSSVFVATIRSPASSTPSDVRASPRRAPSRRCRPSCRTSRARRASRRGPRRRTGRSSSGRAARRRRRRRAR